MPLKSYKHLENSSTVSTALRSSVIRQQSCFLHFLNQQFRDYPLAEKTSTVAHAQYHLDSDKYKFFPGLFRDECYAKWKEMPVVKTSDISTAH